MTTQEIGNRLVELCGQGQFHVAMQELYSNDIVSVEAAAAPGQSREAVGMAAVVAKGEWWASNHEVHGVKVEGPLVAHNHFSVRFWLDVTFKPTGARMQMDELAVYEVKDGKIIREEFFYSMG
jgi:ketosteroid isomerase-like protein